MGIGSSPNLSGLSPTSRSGFSCLFSPPSGALSRSCSRERDLDPLSSPCGVLLPLDSRASPRFDSSSFLSSPRSGLSLWPNWLFVFFFFFSDFSPLRRFFFSFFGTLAFLSVLSSVFSVFGTSCSASFGSFFDSFFASFFAPSFKGDAPNSASSLPSGELRPKGPLSPVSTKSLKAPAAFRRIASTAVSWKPLRRPPRSSLPTLK